MSCDCKYVTHMYGNDRCFATKEIDPCTYPNCDSYKKEIVITISSIKWYSVEDKFPEDDLIKDSCSIKVLTCVAGDRNSITTRRRYRSSHNSPWYWSHLNETKETSPTHWAYLPDPAQ